jgi:Mrp family chromosome partitioning ATPase
MERIQAAIQKAKEQRSEVAPGAAQGASQGTSQGATAPQAALAAARQARQGQAPQPGPAWDAIPAFEPDPQLLARNRIVTFADADPAHSTFDMIRTKILRMMRQNGWTSLGITSPTSGCGKTTACLNIAFSLAHQPDVRTVLVDLDLRRPAIAGLLGLTRPQSMASVLQGTRPPEENFVRYGETLAIGTNTTGLRAASEILLSPATTDGVAAIKAAFQPDIVIYDLPPMLMSDDVMAFLPHLDCVLLIAAAEKSRLDEVDKCEQELSEQTRVLGVVLNKCRYGGEDYGYY